MTTAKAEKTSLKNKQLSKGAMILQLLRLASHPILFTKYASKKQLPVTGRSAAEVIIENERFTVVCPRCLYFQTVCMWM